MKLNNRRLFPTRSACIIGSVCLFAVIGLEVVFAPRPSGPGPVAIRLVDRWHASAAFDGTDWRPGTDHLPWAMWTFEDDSAESRWTSGPGVARLEVREGLLIGHSDRSQPVLFLDRPFDLDRPDLVKSVEIRGRFSAGSRLSVALLCDPFPDPGRFLAHADELSWNMSTPIAADPILRTYSMNIAVPIDSSAVTALVLQPTDEADATFEIDFIRVWFHREYLATIPPGPGWYGLSAVYRECLASRAGGVMRFDVTLPNAPYFDLAVGTIDPRPLRFNLKAERLAADGSTTGSSQRWNRTLTTPARWELWPIDLRTLAGESVRLTLEAMGESGNQVGLWGSPVIRNRVLGVRNRTAAGGNQKARRTRPHGVIVIWVDSLRPDHLPFYGYDRNTAPHLARLAATGAIFDDCVTQGTWTKVATASLLSSQYPATHGVLDFSDRLPESAETMAEVFRSAGYATLSMSSIVITGAFSGFHQGFEELHESLSFPDTGSSKTARHYVDRLLPWLERHHRSPFFVFLHVYDPHSPYKADPPYHSLWGDSTGTWRVGNAVFPCQERNRRSAFEALCDAHWRRIVAGWYRAFVFYRRTDRLVRRLDSRDGPGNRSGN